jgi:hypothetical protein
MADQRLLKRLRNPSAADPETLRELQRYAAGNDSEAVAAIAGFEKLGGPVGVLGITERSLDAWGLRAIDRTIKGLGKLAKDGGLLALSATLLTDYRLYHDKLRVITQAAKKISPESLRMLNQARPLGTIFEIRERSPIVVSILEQSTIDDISYGATICRVVPVQLGPKDVKLGRPSQERLEQAVSYIDRRVPGLRELLMHYNDRGSRSLNLSRHLPK